MPNHYMTDQHQKAILTSVHRLMFKPSNDQHEKSSGMEIDTLPHTTMTMSSSANGNFSAPLQEVYQTIDMLAGAMQALNEDAQRLSNESVRLHVQAEELNRNFAALKLSIQEDDAFLNGFKPNQEILNQDVSSLKQKVEDMESVSYDGSLIWKITAFKEKMSKVSIVPLFRLYKICSSQNSISIFLNLPCS
jgi:chromosome segregation ATPase